MSDNPSLPSTLSGHSPPLKSLRVFAVAAHFLSFKQAAEHLFVTQAAVSQQIRLLEEHIGQPLFIRKNREVRLSSAGQILQGYVIKAFDELDKGLSQLSHDTSPGRLTINCLPSFAGRWLVPAVGRFQQQHSDLNLSIIPGQTLETFENSDTDLAIRFGKGHYPGLQSEHLLDDFVLPVCSAMACEHYDFNASDLSSIPILSDDLPDSDRVWEAFSRQTGIPSPLHSSLFIYDSTMLVDATLSGQGLALLRFSLAQKYLESGQLVCPLPIYWQSSFSYYLVAPEHHFRRPKVIAFRNWITEATQEISESWTRLSHVLSLEAADT